MKNFKFAVLGTVFAASVPCAFGASIPLYGYLNTAGGATFGNPGNATPVVFATSSNLTLGGPLAPGLLTPPPASGSLADFAASTYTINYDSFSTSSIAGAGPTGIPILTIYDTGAASASNPAGGDALTFFATSFGSVTPSGASTEGTVNLYGYFTDGGVFTNSTGEVDFSANGLNNNFTEDLIANQPPAIPEPSSILMLGTGMIGAAGMIRRKISA